MIALVLLISFLRLRGRWYLCCFRAPERNNSTSCWFSVPSTALHPPAHILICTGGCALQPNQVSEDSGIRRNLMELFISVTLTQFLSQSQILILKILNVFLQLKFSPSLNLETFYSFLSGIK